LCAVCQQSAQSLFSLGGESLCVPVHHLVCVLVVLLETGELLLHQDASTVVKVMSWHLFDILHALPTSPSCLLNMVAVREIHEANNAEAQGEPEATILHEVHGAIVVHWVGGHSSVEIFFIVDHVRLELNRIFRSDHLRIRVVEVQLVVNLRLMELTRAAHSLTSNWSSSFLWHSTSVKTEVVDVVLLALLFKLSKTSLSVTSFGWCSHSDIT